MADDVQMESALEQAPAQEIAQFVNQAAFEQLTELAGDQKTQMNAPRKAKTILTEGLAKRHVANGFANLGPALSALIEVAYRKNSVSVDVAAQVATAVASKTKKQFGVADAIEPLTEELTQQLQMAFMQTKYIGDAHVAFEAYLQRCWKLYNPAKYKAPYVSVVQSSGFGKSRMLFELARRAQRAEEGNPVAGYGANMKVLYTCERVHNSTGYPKATVSLRQWLFPAVSEEEDLALRLKAIYEYAIANWDSVQTEWIGLFTNAKADGAVTTTLNNSLRKLPGAEPDQKVKVSKDSNAKIVVLVVDEARSLLAKENSKVNYFRLFRRALARANKDIGPTGGIFGVLIDTNSKISDLTPPVSIDPSSRDFAGNELASFPPFVLTHTMDANWREYCREVKAQSPDKDVKEVANQEERDILDEISVYKAVVIGDENEAWRALTRMGRPMWWSTFTESRLANTSETNVVNLAAQKLMLGLAPAKGTYNESTMFGVASMLCRLGVRPYSTSTLASRAVADFMAILAYVNYEKEGFLSSYASDPVLPLGAMKVWYGVKNGLVDYILPQLKKLILDEALDTGGVGEMVARILLLLAMDKCVVNVDDIAECKLRGQFVSVDRFLTSLGCDNMAIYRKGMQPADGEEKEKFGAWRSQWKGWYVGFTHFVQLQLEPNEGTLWYLLGRRAAGIFPHNQYGADLLIPIFWKMAEGPSTMETDTKPRKGSEKVSLMLIQVKNRSHDSGFSQAASKKLCPWFVFGDRTNKDVNPLIDKPVHEVIRIYMNLGEEAGPAAKFSKFIYSTSFEDNQKKEKEGKGNRKGEENTNAEAEVKRAAMTDVTMEHVSLADDQDAASDDARRKDPCRSVKGGASAMAATEAKEAGGNVFTYCFRLLGCTTFSFLDERLAASLAGFVQSPWDPKALVEGDLEHRRAAEENIKASNLKAVLSKSMPDEELKKIAFHGLAYAPGCAKTDNDRAVSGRRPKKGGGMSSSGEDDGMSSSGEGDKSAGGVKSAGGLKSGGGPKSGRGAHTQKKKSAKQGGVAAKRSRPHN